MSSRTSIACERCRRLRKRCQPPHPCPACRAAGLACQVRSKARPLRNKSITVTQHASTRQPSQNEVAWSPQSICDAAVSKDCASITSLDQVLRSSPSDRVAADRVAADPSLGHVTGSYGLLRYKELLNGIKNLVLDRAEESFGYQLECDLTEPVLALSEVQQVETTQERDLQILDSSCLTECDVIHWMASFKKHMPIQCTIVQDDQQLLVLADGIRQALISQNGTATSPTATLYGSSMARAALLFGVLSLGALCSSDYARAHIFFQESRRLLDDYPGQPTFDLCIAVHLHHIYILVTGTSNRARAFACLSVQIAHDLGLNQEQDSPGNIPSLRLYLLIMTSDQYSAQTHGTKPIISASQLQDGLFDPLIDVEPEILPLLRVMKANSLSLEALAQKDYSWDDVVDLEARIGRQPISTPLLDSLKYPAHSFGRLYWPLAQLHMFWYRLLSRSPFLSEEAGRISSLSICVHSAQMIISLYFDLTYPALKAENCQRATHNKGTIPWRLTDTALPPTWRQVQRIMTASFIVFISYWEGELTKLEASRYTSMALLLLRHQSMRWGWALDGCTNTLERLASSSHLDLAKAKKSLLQDASAEVPVTAVFSDAGNNEASLYVSGGQAGLGNVTGESGDLLSMDGLLNDAMMRTWAEDFMMW